MRRRLRHLFPDEDLSSDADVVLSRSVLLLRNSLLPRHQLLCENSSQSCALLIAATRDLFCRRHGSRLNVLFLVVVVVHWHWIRVWTLCGVRARRRGYAVPCRAVTMRLDGRISYTFKLRKRAGGRRGRLPLIGEAVGWCGQPSSCCWRCAVVRWMYSSDGALREWQPWHTWLWCRSRSPSALATACLPYTN